MSVTGIDIAWDRPTIAEIKATGARWVARYFSPDATKNLTASEVRDYHAAGLGVVSVWEGTATRALDGRAAGVADAHAADQQRASVGLPSDMVIHFAVDTDTNWPAVAPYFDGVRSVLGDSRTGVYGGLRVIEGAHAAGLRYLWQTVAWSGGVWASYATIRQPIGTTLNGGADYDTAEAPDFGQYPRPVAPPPPAPKPTLVEESVLAYLPSILPNVDVDLPVEPAGTVAKPQGGANNGPLWLCLQAQGVSAKVTLTLHANGKLGAPIQATLAAGGPKGVFSLPTDGSVDFVRIHSTAPLIGYVTGRQVA